MKLDLSKFRELNTQRAVEGFKTYENVPLTYWTTALAGEVGELCNMIKKMERVKNGGIDGGSSYTAATLTTADLKEEIGGIAIYLDLLASLMGISLEEAIIQTFNSKSDKYGFKQFLPEKIKRTAGIDLIKREREEQITKHGFTLEDDARYSKNGELVKAAEYCLMLAGYPEYKSKQCVWPTGWSSGYEEKIINKPKVGKLTVAGALLMAEADRRREPYHLYIIEEIAMHIDLCQGIEP